MWKSRHKTVIHELCVLAGIPDSLDLILKTSTLSCQDIPVTLLPGASENSIAVYVQLGHPESSQITAIYRRLLELNLLITHTQSEHFAVDPESGVVVYGFELTNPSAEQLWISIQRATGKAVEWRSTFFLLEEMNELAS